MADMTLLQAIELLEGLPRKVASVGENIMKEEFGNNRRYATGATYKSIHGEVLSSSLVFIGASTEGAFWVEKGRRAVRPVRAKMLHWKDGSKDVFAYYSRAVKPDDYIGRTGKRLKSYNWR